jgi:hypothetical protein
VTRAHSGIEGLKSLPAGRSRRWPFEHICTLLRELIKHSPGDFGYQRSRWSTELLAIKIKALLQIVGGDKLIIPFC